MSNLNVLPLPPTTATAPGGGTKVSIPACGRTLGAAVQNPAWATAFPRVHTEQEQSSVDTEWKLPGTSRQNSEPVQMRD